VVPYVPTNRPRHRAPPPNPEFLMRQIYKSAVLVIAVLGFLVWNLFPVEKNLRLGKDLSGGVSLVYSVQIAANEDAKSVIRNTIEALKRRVDPDGLMEISMVQAGNDRIEITLPLPSA